MLNLGKLTTAIGSREAILNAYKTVQSNRKIRILCMYNSSINMIIPESESELMMIPIDDRSANRAHAVTETTNIRNFRIANIDQHLNRLATSANRLSLLSPLTKDAMIEKIQDLAQVAYQTLEQENFPNLNEQLLILKILLSSGFGDFGIYSYDKTPVFYAVIYISNTQMENLYKGVKEYIFKDLWLDPEYLSTAKTVNYITNSMMADYSKRQDGYQGIKISPEGYLLEGAIANIAFVLKSGEFCTPPFSKIIRGTTLTDAIEIIKRDLIPNNQVKEIKEIDLKYDDVWDECSEMFFLQNEKVIPILKLDEKDIGDGKVGPICTHLQNSIKGKLDTHGLIVKGYHEKI